MAHYQATRGPYDASELRCRNRQAQEVPHNRAKPQRAEDSAHDAGAGGVLGPRV